MKTLFILAALVGTSTSFAMSTVDVDFSYSLTGYAAGTAASLITELKEVEAAATSLNTASADLYGGCLVTTNEIDAVQADAKVFASLHCNGVDSLNQDAVAGLIRGALASRVGVPMQPDLIKPNPGVVMSNARAATKSTGFSAVDLDFAYTLTDYASGSAAALIAELDKVGMAGVHLKDQELYAGGCLVSIRELDSEQSDVRVYASVHCDGTSKLTQDYVANLVDGKLAAAVGLKLEPVLEQHNN